MIAHALLPLPEMVAIPAGTFLMGSSLYENAQPVRDVHVPDFQIGKCAVTMGEMDRYIREYSKTPFGILGTRRPYQDLWVGWGKKPRLNTVKKWETWERRGADAAKMGEVLVRRILRAALSVVVPPVFTSRGGAGLSGLLSAYGVFSDWSASQGFDPFSLLAHLLTSVMNKTKGCFTVCPAVPSEKDWQFRRALSNDERWKASANWPSAYGYARASGARLPTEAEWEKAARGPGRHDYPTASGEVRDGEFDAQSPHRPVGAYPPNGYGLHEMAGDFGEWTMDDMESYDGSTRAKAVRGCGIQGLVDWHEPEVRLHVARRTAYPVDFLAIPGFRLAQSLAR